MGTAPRQLMGERDTPVPGSSILTQTDPPRRLPLHRSHRASLAACVLTRVDSGCFGAAGCSPGSEAQPVPLGRTRLWLPCAAPGPQMIQFHAATRPL